MAAFGSQSNSGNNSISTPVLRDLHISHNTSGSAKHQKLSQMIPMPSVSEAGSDLEDIQEMTSGEEDQMIKHIDGM